MSKGSGKKEFFEDSISLPPTSGLGIQLGNFSDGPAPGTAFGNFGWRDITAPIEVRGVAATDPSWTRIAATNFWTYAFAVNDFVWQCFHIGHDILPNSDIYLHTHWFPSDATSGDVTFQFDYMYARGFNQEAFDPALANSPLTNSGTITVTQAAPGVAYKHMVAETAAITLPTLTEPDGIVYIRMGRIANPQSPINEYAGTCFVLTNDIHYQSTNLATINKAPNFYG